MHTETTAQKKKYNFQQDIMLCQEQKSKAGCQFFFTLYKYLALTQGRITSCHRLIFKVLWPHCHFDGSLGHIEMVLK